MITTAAVVSANLVSYYKPPKGGLYGKVTNYPKIAFIGALALDALLATILVERIPGAKEKTQEILKDTLPVVLKSVRESYEALHDYLADSGWVEPRNLGCKPEWYNLFGRLCG